MARMPAVDDVARKASHRDRPRLWRGLLGGASAGALAWVAYFVQASIMDRWSWQAMVMPTLAVIALGAVVVGAARPNARRTSMGVALGALLTLPVVVATFLVVFVLLDLE